MPVCLISGCAEFLTLVGRTLSVETYLPATSAVMVMILPVSLAWAGMLGYDPARSTLEVAALPSGARVEVEAIALA